MPQQVVPIRLFIDSQLASEQVTLCYARYCHRHYNQLGTNNALNCLIVDWIFVIKLNYSNTHQLTFACFQLLLAVSQCRFLFLAAKKLVALANDNKNIVQ